MAGWQAGLGIVAALFTEFVPLGNGFTVPKYLIAACNDGFGGNYPTMLCWLMGVCVMALTVNFTSFGLIGKTGPIAYAVVGHAKTVLTIILGMTLFPKEDTEKTMVADII